VEVQERRREEARRKREESFIVLGVKGVKEFF
jgi:hypothetical protein